MKKELHFVVNPSEITAGTRGSSLGPYAIMTEARKKRNSLFSRFPITYVQHQNHALDKEAAIQGKAKYISEFSEVFTALSSEVRQIAENNKIPVVLSGDHGSAAATISALKLAAPEKRLGVIWVDAHADIHSPYTTPSGNMHGMPLAIALGTDNKECQVNELPSELVEQWNQLKNFGGICPKILPQDLIYVGVRDTEEQEDYVLKQEGIRNFVVDDFKKYSPKMIADQILSQLADCDWIYLSFDVDSMDPVYSSFGTGTPVENGLHPDEAKSLILHLLESGRVGCFEIVEVNPCLDDKVNRMAELAFDVLDSSIKVLSELQ